MSRERTEHKWIMNFNGVVVFFEGLEKLEKISIEDLENGCTMLRNPIIFDNNVKVSQHVVGKIVSEDGDAKYTNDHLIGISNIVLYMYKNKLYKKWKNHNDFIPTLKALQALIICPVKLNSIKKYKSDWLFNYENINKCIEWNKKLKNNNINEILVNGEMVDVDIEYDKWVLEYKEFLI